MRYPIIVLKDLFRKKYSRVFRVGIYIYRRKEAYVCNFSQYKIAQTLSPHAELVKDYTKLE